jgi:hypothetical protein
VTQVKIVTQFKPEEKKLLEPSATKVIMMVAIDKQNNTGITLAAECDGANNLLRLGQEIKQLDADNDPVVTTIREAYDKSGKIGQDKEVDFPKSGHTFLANLPSYKLQTDFTFPEICNGKIPQGFVAQLNAPLPPSYKIGFKNVRPNERQP